MYSINQNGLSHDDVIFKVEIDVKVKVEIKVKLERPSYDKVKSTIVSSQNLYLHLVTVGRVLLTQRFE